MRLLVDNLTNVDFSYLHPSRGLVGETWLASIELEGELDEQGMICDFGIVKSMLRQWLDQQLDHCLLVPRSAHALANLTESEDRVEVSWLTTENDRLKCASPKQAITVIETADISPETVANWCVNLLKPKFPASVKALTLKFTHEDIPGPFYHYSHGLKKHKGNCQRIAHGHRSKIEIWKDGVVCEQTMTTMAKKWKDIYIGSQEDITETGHKGQVAFRYTSEQGEFYLELPKDRCILINTDSTVELLAQHIAQEVKNNEPNHRFTIKAYEGLAKGAIVDI